MSSMLLKPTMRVPFTCSAPNRLDVSTIGSPSVFHTAPPQPMSNARMICSPVFVGGALASQNGLGLLMPANEIDRSAMGVHRMRQVRGSRARSGVRSEDSLRFGPNATVGDPPGLEEGRVAGARLARPARRRRV